jgi:hypothetical protein
MVRTSPRMGRPVELSIVKMRDWGTLTVPSYPRSALLPIVGVICRLQGPLVEICADYAYDDRILFGLYRGLEWGSHVITISKTETAPEGVYHPIGLGLVYRPEVAIFVDCSRFIPHESRGMILTTTDPREFEKNQTGVELQSNGHNQKFLIFPLHYTFISKRFFLIRGVWTSDVSFIVSDFWQVDAGDVLTKISDARVKSHGSHGERLFCGHLRVSHSNTMSDSVPFDRTRFWDELCCDCGFQLQFIHDGPALKLIPSYPHQSK